MHRVLIMTGCWLNLRALNLLVNREFPFIFVEKDERFDVLACGLLSLLGVSLLASKIIRPEITCLFLYVENVVFFEIKH